MGAKRPRRGYVSSDCIPSFFTLVKKGEINIVADDYSYAVAA